MRIGDLDWKNGLLHVHGKGRQSVRLPLPQDAGDAVPAGLHYARPVVPQKRVLLGIAAPFKPFASSSGISGILSRLLTRADIHGVPSGSHMFRHSLDIPASQRHGPSSHRHDIAAPIAGYDRHPC